MIVPPLDARRSSTHFPVMSETTTKSMFRELRPPEAKPPRRSEAGRGGAPVERTAKLDPRAAGKDLPPEVGGYDGPEPTRFGDWEHKGRCTDF